MGEESDRISLKLYKKDAMTVARDLCYGPKIILQIHDAKSISEVERIMVSARKGRD